MGNIAFSGAKRRAAAARKSAGCDPASAAPRRALSALAAPCQIHALVLQKAVRALLLPMWS
jgi:hypothetical protein